VARRLKTRCVVRESQKKLNRGGTGGGGSQVLEGTVLASNLKALGKGTDANGLITSVGKSVRERPGVFLKEYSPSTNRDIESEKTIPAGAGKGEKKLGRSNQSVGGTVIIGLCKRRGRNVLEEYMVHERKQDRGSSSCDKEDEHKREGGNSAAISQPGPDAVAAGKGETGRQKIGRVGERKEN